MDPIGPAVEQRRDPLTPPTRSVLRPIRFDPPQLSGSVEIRGRAGEQAERLSLEFAEARASGLIAAQHEIDEAVAAHDAARRSLEQASAVLARAAASLDARELLLTTELEDAALRLAIGITEELLGRELRSCDDAVATAIVRAARMVPDRGAIVLRVHPDETATARSAVEETPGLADRAEVRADPSVEPGGCIVTADQLRIDTQIGPALERVRTALLG